MRPVAPTYITDDPHDPRRFSVFPMTGTSSWAVWDSLRGAECTVFKSEDDASVHRVCSACRKAAQGDFFTEDGPNWHARGARSWLAAERHHVARVLWGRDDEEALEMVGRLDAYFQGLLEAWEILVRGDLDGAGIAFGKSRAVLAALPAWVRAPQ